MKKVKDEKNKNYIKIKKIIIIILSIIIAITLSVLIFIYFSNIQFRKWVDIKILNKNITTENVITIDLNAEKNNQIFCYSGYICILKEKNLILYNSSGFKDTEISVDINTALFDSNDKYLAIAEKNGQNFCVVYGKAFLWKGKIDGEIKQIKINRNGYVLVITSDTTYKSIITLFNSEGKAILKKYLPSSRIVDVAISNDNSYIAFCELDSTGVLIKSNIEIISVEKARNSVDDATVYKYEAPNSKLISKLNYQDKNDLVCMFDDSISIINLEKEPQNIAYSDNTTFASVNLNNHIAYIEEAGNLFNYNSKLTILNVINRQINVFEFEEIAKEMYTYGNTIGINTGTEIYFLNTSGMLLKKYISKQEITKVLISNNLGLIVYKDKIEIINL